MALDPNKATRAEFTASQLSCPPPPEGANPEWSHKVKSLLALLKAISEDESMASNNQQTYMTPAVDKNGLYFAWDFVGRTLSYAISTDPFTLDPKDRWNDVISRSTLIASLLLDEKPGLLNKLVERSYPGHNPNGHPAISDRIKAAARELGDGPKA